MRSLILHVHLPLPCHNSTVFELINIPFIPGQSVHIPLVSLLIRKLSFGGTYQIEVSAELFGIAVKEIASFTCKKNPQLNSSPNGSKVNIYLGGVSSDSATTTTGTTSATSVACVATGTLAPNKGVKVTGSYQTGTGSFDYTSTVTVLLKD